MILDLKTGAPARWHELQVAAYEHGTPAPDLDFDAELHVYRDVGEIVPSVTQILFDMGCISEFSTFSEFARDRGTAVHAACALLPERLDWSTVDDRCLPYVQSFQRWLETTKAGILAQEQRVYLLDVDVAGTLDLRVNNGMSGTLYLQADGSLAKFKACDVRRSWAIFVSMVNVWRFKNGN